MRWNVRELMNSQTFAKNKSRRKRHRMALAVAYRLAQRRPRPNQD
jgi:hypothetical protein